MYYQCIVLNKQIVQYLIHVNDLLESNDCISLKCSLMLDIFV